MFLTLCICGLLTWMWPGWNCITCANWETRLNSSNKLIGFYKCCDSWLVLLLSWTGQAKECLAPEQQNSSPQEQPATVIRWYPDFKYFIMTLLFCHENNCKVMDCGKNWEIGLIHWKRCDSAAIKMWWRVNWTFV